jgi:transposase-like protein
LVIVGVRADGTKELVAVADGERESTDSWAELLRDLRRRGMRAPVVAVGDGALGLWAALREVFPATRHQRDWVHKLANVLGCLPKSVQAGARRALAEIRDAPDCDHAQQAIGAFARDYGVKWPKAVARSPTTPTSCCASSTSPPSTGCTSRPPTPSSPPSPPSGSAPGSLSLDPPFGIGERDG